MLTKMVKRNKMGPNCKTVVQALVAPQVPRFRGLEWIQALRVNGVTEDHVDLAKMFCCAKKAVGGDKDRYRQMRTSHEPDDLGKLFDPP